VSVLWAILVLGGTAGIIPFFFLWFVGSSIGVDDGANRVPLSLLLLSPIVAFLLLIGGLWFILTRRTTPDSVTARFGPADARSSEPSPDCEGGVARK